MLREIMEKAHQAQIKAGKSIPLQLSLFPPRISAWDDEKQVCPKCHKRTLQRVAEGNYEGDWCMNPSCDFDRKVQP